MKDYVYGKKLAEKLIKARKDANLTQKKATELLGRKHQSYLSKVESGEKDISFSELELFAKVYKVPITFFESKTNNSK